MPDAKCEILNSRFQVTRGQVLLHKAAGSAGGSVQEGERRLPKRAASKIAAQRFHKKMPDAKC